MSVTKLCAFGKKDLIFAHAIVGREIAWDALLDLYTVFNTDGLLCLTAGSGLFPIMVSI